MATTQSGDEHLLEQCILALEEGDDAAVAALLAAHPAHAQAVREQLDRLEVIGILHCKPTSATIPERLGEFRLLQKLGRGGMGVVYLAEQESLRRRVALKLVHPENLFFPGARERFRREVLAVARLGHPGIVPIFTCGEAEGVPYYAMEYLQGGSLAELLHELGGVAPASLDASALRAALQRTMAAKGEELQVPDAPLFHGSWVKACCRIVQAAAEAVQHAHEHGVLHRDLKPSNVMLTRDGVVRLIDFGLASAQGEQRLTRSGAAFGSLPYMAPEQVRGEVAAVDQRTDVYTLGVTLYEMLTLTLPHGDGSGTTRERILTGAFEPPTRRNAQVHPDAEAICMLAMDPEPLRRYASPQELAADLGAFLDGRAVRARRLPALVRLQRWTRRYPARATALMALSLLAGGATWYAIEQQSVATRISAALETARSEYTRAEVALAEVTRQKDLAQAALAEATRQQERATRNLDQAVHAVEQMLVRTAANHLAEIPRTAKLQRQLLEDALALEEGLLADADNEASQQVREELARTRARVGKLRERLGDLPGALEILAQAITDLERLLPQSARPAALHGELAEANKTLAAVYARNDRLDDQVTALLAASRHLELQCEHQPARADDVRIAIADLRLNLAGTYGRLHRGPEAHAILDAVEQDLDPARMPELTPEQQESWLLAYASTADVRGVQHSRDGDTAAADADFTLAVQRIDRLGDGAAKSLAARAQRAGCLERLALIASQRRRWELAMPRLEQAVTAYEALVREEPDRTRWRASLSVLLGTRADARRQLGDQAGSNADGDRAIELIEAIVAAFPDETTHRMRLAIALAERGSAISERGDHGGALAVFRRSIEQFELLLKRRPQDEQYLANLVAALGNCAQAEFASGDLGAARATMQRAVAICRQRKGGENQRALIELLGQAGELAFRDDDLDQGRALMAEASDLAKVWLAERPDDGVRQLTAVLTAINVGTMHLSFQEHEAATAVWLAALPVARAANGRAGPMARSMLALLLLRLCDVCVRDDRLPEARDWFRKAIAETSVKRSEMERYDPVPALFDRPDFKDLLPAGSDK